MTPADVASAPGPSSQGRRGPSLRDVLVLGACALVVVVGVVIAFVGPVGTDAPPVAGPPSAVAAPAAGPSPPSPVPSGPAVPTGAPAPSPATSSAAPPVVTPSAPPATAAPPVDGATPAPAWLGTRPLGPPGSGPVPPQTTPPELQDRRVVTVDVLPPPAGEGFTPVVSAVPPDVLARSTWTPACPVPADDLRYLLVPFRGFDGRLHTGEVLVHADAVDAVLAVFAALHAEGFPLEEVRVVRPDELTAAPTGDGNVTSAFVCRPAVGDGGWSQHAYGRALDVNPFHNPYDAGEGSDRVVLPELATAYTDRTRGLPGMLDEGSAAVRAAEAQGWGWGGRYRTLEDWMHFSADGS